MHRFLMLSFWDPGALCTQSCDLDSPPLNGLRGQCVVQG